MRLGRKSLNQTLIILSSKLMLFSIFHCIQIVLFHFQFAQIVLFHLPQHFSYMYLNSLWSQRVRISDFLLYVANSFYLLSRKHKHLLTRFLWLLTVAKGFCQTYIMTPVGSNNWPTTGWDGWSTEGCFRGRHTGQSGLSQFFQWVMIWREEAQWGSARRRILLSWLQEMWINRER